MYSKIFFVVAMFFLMEIPLMNSMPAKAEWPERCKGKSYCPFRPKHYPQNDIDNLLKDVSLDLEQYNGMTNRSGEEKDVGDCGSRKLYKPLYLIIDEDDNIRYVAQSQNFSVIVQIEECRNPGKQEDTRFLDNSLLQQDEVVYCFETRLPLELPVLSRDGLGLESVAPKGGISVSCSAKLVKTAGA